MFKVALLAATLLAGVTMTGASAADTTLAEPQGSDADCRLVSSLDMACALRIADAGSDAVPVLVDTAPSVVAYWAEPRTNASPGDFKDADLTPGAMLPATLERDQPRALIPALAALAAMVILLRRRPTSF